MVLNFFRRHVGFRIVLLLLIVAVIAALTAGNKPSKKPVGLGRIETVAYTPGCVDKASPLYYAHQLTYGNGKVVGTTKWYLRICWGPGGWITSVTSNPDNNMYTWANFAGYHIHTGMFQQGSLPSPSVALSQFMKIGNQASDAQTRLTVRFDGPAASGGGVRIQYYGWGWKCENTQCVNYGPSYSFYEASM